MIEQKIIQLYAQGESLYSIAKLTGWSHMTVKRLLEKYTVPMRSKSEAQKIALREKRAKLPQRGKKNGSADYTQTPEKNNDKDSGSGSV